MSTPAPESPEPPRPGVPDPGGPTGAVLAVLTAVVVAVLVVPVAIGVVHATRGADGDGDGAVTAPSTSAPGEAPSATPPATGRPRHQPSHTAEPGRKPSRKPKPSASAPASSAAPAATCWDGSAAPAVAACSEPQGEQGLTWVFPSIAGQRCAPVTSSGPDGLVQRRICRAHTDSGARVVIVYAQWTSIATAVTYIKGKGLTAIAPGTGVQQFLGSGKDGAKAAQVYTEEPFSYIATVAPGGDADAAVAQVVTSRPPDQVRGQP